MDQFKMQGAMSGMLGGAPAPEEGASASAGQMASNQSMPPPLPAKEPASLEAILSQAQNAGDRSNQHHPVAEFLYQLTKMLTDDNSEIIEWVDGRIKVHHPERLEGEVLHKYFRHSKFASFQRQLNYFGFRKIAGKGKMSPCSYVNESATSDIRSLLLIKRKTNGSAARKAMAQRAIQMQQGLNPALGSGLPGLAGAPGLGFGGFGSLGALNQLQMQKQLSAGLLAAQADNPLSQFLAQGQQQSWSDLQQLGGLKPNMPSIEQLQAQLATLSKQQNQGAATAALNAAALGMVQGQQNNNSSENPATAALNASSMPATSASQAANAAAGQSNNLFESATNLKALIGNDQGNDAQNKAPAPGNYLNRLSAGGVAGLTSNASLGNLLASSNRLNSLLSLNSFLSREPSLADFGMIGPNAAQLAALQQQQSQMASQLSQQQQQQQSQQSAAPS
eukprot:CAMPEP_0176020758 /NCGR_PEP_ID=MMETSP0120_2-20121206/10064_1 /TAXON_ID=160619 /ORGANISM="Kryptoperidinium foliaceum, Strain CCMP 1326" /LENGTH=448 /DNA_ID=CAMNT_0017353861 /DNA_START=34 /DNA_END=1380 /DNA_ORIENTATION=+